MTRDDIIHIAIECGIDITKDTLCRYEGWVEPMEKFAAFVYAAGSAAGAAAEREECANFIENEYVRQFEEPWRQNLAKAIRARGQG